jgi:hypothetical protein
VRPDEEVAIVEDREPVYLPIGLPYGGIMVPSSKGPRCILRHGGRLTRVPLSIFRLWRKSLNALNRDELREVAARNGDLGRFERDLQRLVEAQLLIPWTKEGENLNHFSHLRVIPCGIGGGNLPDHPETFALLRRTDQNPVLWVDVVAFTLYGHFDGIATLDDACLATAKRLDYPVDEVRERALTLLPALMRNGLVFIDLAVR